MLSTRRCNRLICRCRRLVVIGFHSVNRPPSSPYRIGQHPFQPSFSSPCAITSRLDCRNLFLLRYSTYVLFCCLVSSISILSTPLFCRSQPDVVPMFNVS